MRPRTAHRRNEKHRPNLGRLRFAALAISMLATAALASAGQAWAAPDFAQGTVPGGGETVSNTSDSGMLNAGTGTVTYGRGACVGTCTVVPTLDPIARQTAPAGLVAGLKLTITGLDRPGVPRTTVCFLATTVTRPTIRYYDTTLNRWVRIGRTFMLGEQMCFRGRLTGSMGLFGG